MRFRAGFRRVDVPMPTEYNLQYTWKNPVTEETPILHAANLVNGQRVQPSNHQQQRGGSHKDERRREREGIRNGERHSPQVASQQNGGNAKRDDVVNGSCDLEDLPDGRGGDVPGLRQKSGTKSPPKREEGTKHPHQSESKTLKKKLKSHHHHHKHHHCGSRKHKGGRGKGFLSEYKREFKEWPIPSSASGTAGGKQGKAKGAAEGEEMNRYHVYYQEYIKEGKTVIL